MTTTAQISNQKRLVIVGMMFNGWKIPTNFARFPLGQNSGFPMTNSLFKMFPTIFFIFGEQQISVFFIIFTPIFFCFNFDIISFTIYSMISLNFFFIFSCPFPPPRSCLISMIFSILCPFVFMILIVYPLFYEDLFSMCYCPFPFLLFCG